MGFEAIAASIADALAGSAAADAAATGIGDAALAGGIDAAAADAGLAAGAAGAAGSAGADALTGAALDAGITSGAADALTGGALDTGLTSGAAAASGTADALSPTALSAGLDFTNAASAPLSSLGDLTGAAQYASSTTPDIFSASSSVPTLSANAASSATSPLAQIGQVLDPLSKGASAVNAGLALTQMASGAGSRRQHVSPDSGEVTGTPYVLQPTSAFADWSGSAPSDPSRYGFGSEQSLFKHAAKGGYIDAQGFHHFEDGGESGGNDNARDGDNPGGYRGDTGAYSGDTSNTATDVDRAQAERGFSDTLSSLNDSYNAQRAVDQTVQNANSVPTGSVDTPSMSSGNAYAVGANPIDDFRAPPSNTVAIGANPIDDFRAPPSSTVAIGANPIDDFRAPPSNTYAMGANPIDDFRAPPGNTITTVANPNPYVNAVNPRLGDNPGYAQSTAMTPSAQVGIPTGPNGAFTQNDIQRVVDAVSNRTGVDSRLINAMIQKESGFNPNAVGSAGEIGLMQVKPSTYMDPGYGMSKMPNASDLRDPLTNVEFGVNYLQSKTPGANLNNPDDRMLALENYNAGKDKIKYAEDITGIAGMQPDLIQGLIKGLAGNNVVKNIDYSTGVAIPGNPQAVPASVQGKTAQQILGGLNSINASGSDNRGGNGNNTPYVPPASVDVNSLTPDQIAAIKTQIGATTPTTTQSSIQPTYSFAPVPVASNPATYGMPQSSGPLSQVTNPIVDPYYYTPGALSPYLKSRLTGYG